MRRGTRPGLVLASLCLSLTVITMNNSLLNVGLPTLARQLQATNAGLEWIVDGYALVFAGFLMVAGSLGDRFGGRPVMLAGLAVFGACSLGATVSHSTAELIVARSGMGLGGALVTPMTLSVMREVYPDEVGLRRAVGLWAATASAGAIVAPLVAGALLSVWWWGSLFLVNVPLAVVMGVAVWLTVPDPLARRASPFDWPGIALSVLVPTGAVFALIEGPDRGWSSPEVAGALALTAASLGSFVWWERRCTHPLVELSCFRDVRFSAGCGVVAMQYFLSFGASFLVTQYLQLVLGLTPLATGIAFMPSAAVLMLIAPYGARAFGRYGARAVTTVALLMGAGGAALLLAIDIGSSIVVVLLSLIVINVAVGLMAAGTTSMVMSAVRPDQAGMASGMQNTTRQVGGALGVAVLGSVAATRYGATVTGRLRGTVGARSLAVARRSLADAVHAAGPSGPAHALLVRVARAAFVDAMHLAALYTVVVAGLVAGAVWLALGRQRRATTSLSPAPGTGIAAAVTEVLALGNEPDEAST